MSLFSSITTWLLNDIQHENYILDHLVKAISDDRLEQKILLPKESNPRLLLTE